MVGLRRWLCTLGAAATQVISVLAVVNGEVKDTILILARTQYEADTASVGFKGYGIPFETVLVPQTGFSLPALNSSATLGNYGGIITVSELSYYYDPPGEWHSALSSSQWDEIYEYQLNFGVRLVRIEAWPQEMFGTDVAIPWDGCCADGVEQKIYFTNDSSFPTANIKLNAPVSTINQWHTPAVITNPSIATQFAAFEPSGAWTSPTVAGVINRIGGREQMVWFLPFATDWALAPNFLQHATIHFVTRGLFVGARKIYFNTQIDDVMLDTPIWQTSPEERFRIRVSDLEAHAAWQADLTANRMPPGSDYFLELAHNGAGNLEFASTEENDPTGICTPDPWVFADYPESTPSDIEFVNPLDGTDPNYWKPTYTSYMWSDTCAKLDDLGEWFTDEDNLNQFAHLSHTYTHLHLSDVSYSDADKEIRFNQGWLASMGIDQAEKFSPHGLVPPAISGLHNGYAIKAFMDNGIWYVVGDNTRAPLRSTESEYWPITTTVANDGYDGLVIIPRWATEIYYNCDTGACTTAQYNSWSGRGYTFAQLLEQEKDTNVKRLLGLHQDPFMFHQANLRQDDMPNFTVGSYTNKMSLVMIWVETVIQELARLTNWPIVTLKHDDIAEKFIARKTRDLCNPHIRYQITSSGTLTGAVLSADGNSCDTPLPVTVPGASTVSGGGATLDQVGTEPPIQWVTLSGSTKTISLTTPISL